MKNKYENKSSHSDAAKTDHRSADKINQSTRNTRSGSTKPKYPILGEKAEDYLREQANIEDLPDEKDEAEYSGEIEKTKKKNNKRGE